MTAKEECIENFITILLSQRLLDTSNPSDEKRGITKQDLQMRTLRIGTFSLEELVSNSTVLEEITRQILIHQPLKLSILNIINTQDETYYDLHIPGLFNEFLEDLWVEKWWRSKPDRKLRARTRAGHPLPEKLVAWLQNREKKKMGTPHCRIMDVNLVYVMKRIWCVESIFWIGEGEHERFVRGSMALQVLIDGLKGLRKSFVGIESRE